MVTYFYISIIYWQLNNNLKIYNFNTEKLKLYKIILEAT